MAESATTDCTVPYVEYPALSALSPHVECAWSWTRSADRRARTTHVVLPDTCLDLIVDLNRLEASVVGTMSVAHEVGLDDGATLVGIRFAPGGAFRILKTPLGELTDHKVPLADLGPNSEALVRSVAGLGPGAAAEMLQRELAARPPVASEPGPRFNAMIRALTRDPSPRLGELSDRLGRSRQHLTRRCRDLVGISPMRLVRIARLRRLLRLVKDGAPGGWAGAAAAAGYYDQPHMIADVKALTGSTPGQLGAG